MLINVKMSTIVGILAFMSRINSVLSSVEYVKSFITSGPGLFPAPIRLSVFCVSSSWCIWFAVSEYICQFYRLSLPCTINVELSILTSRKNASS